MALLEVDFYATSLMRTVTFQAILPSGKRMEDELKGLPPKPLKTLYLLHGAMGNQTDYISGTRIQRWAEDRNLAVIMPAGENQFYIDKPSRGENYGSFVAQELVQFTRNMFPLSTKKEDTFIAGLSMGGYGALINGLKYQDTFSRIGAFSPALIINDIINQSDFVATQPWQPDFYENVFGKIDSLKNSDRNYEFLLQELVDQKQEIPPIYLPIGKDDFLIKSVREFKEFSDKLDLPLTYIEDEGAHEWDFWDKYLKNFLEWLPLEDKESYTGSGNVLD